MTGLIKTRRELFGLAGGLAASALPGIASAQSAATLKSVGAAKGLIVGSACDSREIGGNANYKTLLAQESAAITPTWELQMKTVQPTQNTFVWADGLVSYCTSNGMKVHGHALHWHQLTPDWVSSIAAGDPAKRVQLSYIMNLVSHYRGRMWAWDVVNEPIYTEDGRPDGLRNSIWLRLIGADYISRAFKLARQADATAILVLNEYGFYYSHPYHELRRQALLTLLESLVYHGVPITALGIQSHLIPGGQWGALDVTRFGRFLSDVTNLGLKLMITEFDVCDKYLPSDVATRDQRVCDAAKEYLDLVLSYRSCISLQTWGSCDRYSWLNWSAPRSDGQQVRPLPFDNDLQKKSLYATISRSIASAPDR
jgi:endo-1,4-beta-xylanase